MTDRKFSGPITEDQISLTAITEDQIRQRGKGRAATTDGSDPAEQSRDE